MGWDGPFRVDRVEAVEAEDGVEVDQPAALELADLGLGQLDPGAVGLGELVQLAAKPNDGSPPQFGGMDVPHDGGLIVVAVGAQRPAQAGVGFLVPLATGEPPSVGAVVRDP
jgi:hypothetical protein